jgi:methyl-accepting chemotaxis protein
MIRLLRDSAIESEGIGEELSASTEEISTAVVQMAATGESINEKSSTLAREASQADEYVRDIIDSMKEMGSVSQDESAAVEQSSAAVEEMVASIQNITRISQERASLIRSLSEQAATGRREMEQTRVDVQSIAESAGAIQQVLKVIQDISERINLLAMNAAIEAAHAGDAGRGFAVVAEEIRKLAESTAGNSAQIAGSVKEIVEKIDAATQRSDETAQSISRIYGGKLNTVDIWHFNIGKHYMGIIFFHQIKGIVAIAGGTHHVEAGFSGNAGRYPSPNLVFVIYENHPITPG